MDAGFYTDDDPNVLAMLSNGDREATILTAPRSSMDGQEMILFPTMNANHVIVAIDHDTVMETGGVEDDEFMRLVQHAATMIAQHFHDLDTEVQQAVDDAIDRLNGD